MKYQEAKEKIDSFPSGSRLRIEGYFDFPKRTTDRIGTVVSYDSNAVTIDEEDGKDLKVLNYENIVVIKLDRGLLSSSTSA